MPHRTAAAADSQRTQAVNPQDRTVLRLPMLLLLASLILCGATALTLLRPETESRVYRLAAERFLAGETFYRTEPKAFSYPPFCVLPYAPLVALDSTMQRWAWSAFNLTLFFASLWFVSAMVFPISRRGEAKRQAPHWLCVLIVLLLAGRFLASPLEYESNDVIILALIVTFAYLQAYARPKLAAVAGGIAAACKATPLLLLPLLAWQRRFAAAGVFAAVLLAATLLPDLLVRNPAGGAWVNSWYNRFVSKVNVGEAPKVKGAWIAWNPHNQSLVGTVHRLATPVKPTAGRINVALGRLEGIPLKLVPWCLQAAVLAAVFCCSWPKLGEHLAPHERPFLHLGQTSAAACGMLLLSPMSSTQHFCALLLPIAFIVVHVLYRRTRVWSLGCCAALGLLGPIAAQDVIGSEIADPLAAYGGNTLITLLCLAACCKILLTEMHLPAAAAPAVAEPPVETPLRAAA